MIRLFTFLISFLLITSCATIEETTEPDSDPEADETDLAEEEHEGPHPEWYFTDTAGMVEDGRLSAFARSPGSDEGLARQNAEEQVRANLRFWIDGQVEEARSEVAGEIGAASDSRFIRELRNAVNKLDLDNIQLDSASVENENGTLHVYARADAVSSDLLEELSENLSGYSEIWDRMTEVEPLRSWSPETAEEAGAGSS